MIRLPRSAPSNQVFRGLETDGALIVEGFLEAEKLMTLKAVVTALADQNASGASGEARFWQAFHGSKTKRFTGIGLHTEIFFDLLEDELLQTLGDALLTTSGSQYWMNTCQAMIIGPGERAQMLHRDCDNWSSVTSLLWPNCPELTFSMILALDKVDEAVGATRVIPGSHLWLDHSRIGDPNDAEAAELAAGDALVYSGKVIHGGGENQTLDRWRWALHLSFVVGWLTPEEAASHIFTREHVANRSERTKRLLGFSAFNPYPARGGRLWLKDFQTW